MEVSYSRVVRAKIGERIASEVETAVVERFVSKMDAVAQDWVLLKENSCRDAFERKILPEELYVKISACLDSSLVLQRTALSMLAQPERGPAKIEEAYGFMESIEVQITGCQDRAIYSYYGSSKQPGDDEGERAVDDALAEAELLLLTEQPRVALGAASAAARTASRAGQPRQVVAALLNESAALQRLARYDAALEAASAALGAAKVANFAVGEAASKARLAAIYMELAEFERAISLYEEALDEDARLLGEAHPVTIKVRMELGHALSVRSYPGVIGPASDEADEFARWNEGAARDRDAALGHALKAVQLAVGALGEESPLVLDAYEKLVGVLRSARREDEALLVAKKMVAACERMYGMRHLRTAQAYSTMSLFLGLTREFAKKALDIRLAVIKSDGPAAAELYKDVSDFLLSRGETAQAEAYARKGLRSCERDLGPEHPDCARFHEHLAYLHGLEGNLNGAIEELRAVVSIYEDAYGPHHYASRGARLDLRGLEERASSAAEAGSARPGHPQRAR